MSASVRHTVNPNPNIADVEDHPELPQDGVNFFRDVLSAMAIAIPCWALLIWWWLR